MKIGQDSPTSGLEALIVPLLGLTIVGILLYWGAVFCGLIAIESLAPGYVDWFMAFPLADLWIAVAGIVALLFGRRDKHIGSVFLAACGSGLIFLGLNAFAYGYRTGLLFTLTVDEIVEVAIKVYCLTVGGLFLTVSSRTPLMNQ